MLLDIRQVIDLVVKAFALGLFISIILDWMNPAGLREMQAFLNRFYDRFLDPIRRYVRPIKFFRGAPVGLDLAPLILLLLVWWIIHPFLMWILG